MKISQISKGVIIKTICCIVGYLAAIEAQLIAYAESLPEPGLIMYGTVRDTANSNAQIISGTLTWTFTPASDSPVTVTTPLTDISGQSSSVAADVRRLPSISDLGLPIDDLKHEPRHLGGYAQRSSGT